MTTLLKRRLFSSPKAFAETIKKHLNTMTGQPQQPRLSKGDKVLPRIAERLEETADDDEQYAEAEQDALSAASRCGPPLSAEELSMLHKLRDWARWAADRPDAKFAALRKWLDPIARPDGDWSDERVILFTEYRDTQRWLYEQLLHAGYPKERLGLLYGGQDEKEREHVKNVFTGDPGQARVRVLLATDAASEGINLQDQCHRVLHWEIPWNPNRLEQRNGRVDRHGQRAPVVEIRHFVPSGWQRETFDTGTLDDELAFLRVAVEKVEQIRADLGSAGDVIAAQVEQKMLGRRTDWQTADIEIAQRATRARLKVDRDLARDLEKLTAALVESRTDLDLTSQAIERVVRTALNLAHRKDLIPTEAPDGFHGCVFRLPELPGAWASARNTGLHHPLTGAERPVTFDQDATAGRKDVVLLHLGHSLVQMCLHLLREELWSQARGIGGAAKLSRVTTRVLPGGTPRHPVVVAHGRVVITGAEGSRLHEEIVTAGGVIEAGKFVRAKENELGAWLSAASEEPAPEPIQRTLTELWSTLADPLRRTFDTRAKQCARRLKGLLSKRCEEEIDAIGKIMDELDRSIRTALSEYGQVYQPSLFTVDERDQLQTDQEALIARLDSLPVQREREITALRARYADPREHWFPAAVTFLVPASIAHAGGIR